MVQLKSLTAFSTLLTAISADCYHGLSTRQADGTVKPNAFNYTALGGPLNWFGLSSANSACSEGKFQSPINIETSAISYATAGLIKMEVPSVQSAKFENLGSGMEVVMPNGTLVINGTTYPLAQFHFHTPSEHRVNNEYFPMECHFVFETSSMYLSHISSAVRPILTSQLGGSIAVVAFLLQLSTFGYTTPLFDSVFAHLDAITLPGTFTQTGPLDFSGIIHHLYSHGIYEYSGSLTTPPCSESVPWLISTEPLPVNVQTYNAVKSILKYNARYTQNSLGQPNLLENAAAELPN